jgi:hypothetical protein
VGRGVVTSPLTPVEAELRKAADGASRGVCPDPLLLTEAADTIADLRRELGDAKAKAYLAAAAVESMAAELDGLAAQIKNKAEQ